MKTLTRVLVQVALGAALATAAAQPADALDAAGERGRNLAQRNCARCHAVGRVGESPLKAAPPFRTLHNQYPIENLAESFAEGIVTGHAAMPEFRFNTAQIEDLFAYLRSLER
jgi:mono/diheme cytochrome c family protein